MARAQICHCNNKLVICSKIFRAVFVLFYMDGMNRARQLVCIAHNYAYYSEPKPVQMLSYSNVLYSVIDCAALRTDGTVFLRLCLAISAMGRAVIDRDHMIHNHLCYTILVTLV